VVSSTVVAGAGPRTTGVFAPPDELAAVGATSVAVGFASFGAAVGSETGCAAHPPSKKANSPNNVTSMPILRAAIKSFSFLSCIDFLDSTIIPPGSQDLASQARPIAFTVSPKTVRAHAKRISEQITHPSRGSRSHSRGPWLFPKQQHPHTLAQQAYLLL